ncbi:hypothetical protein PHET_10260 [Paragonimus heterotremus]|uniref:Uncharacterized protein n=1 Tax=Paragonimus heterotremus TaxID=100268 RepID=A0A8J4T7X9_9TREM|nr:hypothetical protein PHET_10260 [Paragonimus heterotremus]
MLPCSVLFCGKTWDSVVDELKYFVALDRLNISCKCHSEGDNRPSMAWWKNNIQNQLQAPYAISYESCVPLSQFKMIARCRYFSTYCWCKIPSGIHVIMKLICPILCPVGELSLEQTAHELERITSAFERALSLGLYNSEGISPRHLSLYWTRLAYRLSTQCVIQCHSEVPDMFLTALRFLLILEVADVDTWRCAALCLPRPLYFALTGLLCTSTQEAHQTAPSSGGFFPENPGTTLLNRFLLELENLVELANRFDAFGTVTTKDGGSLSKLACILFDRLACLTFFAIGATHKTHPSLWNTLYEEMQAKSVELWSAFWLESDNNYYLHN